MNFKKSLLLFLAFQLWGITACPAEAITSRLQKDLPQFYKDWLAKDVIYIITPKEKEVFLELRTEKERDIFVQAFWKQRDPTPGTPANEFKEEHYRRISYANEHFGRETSRPGWMTDRGKIYILLGPPQDISAFEGGTFVHPVTIWSYQGKPEYGLPSYFDIAFYKRRGMGEYILYSPTLDGPMSLLINYRGDPIDVSSAYQQLRKYNVRLAEVSLSLIPGESLSFGQPSLASDMLIGQLSSLPEKVVDATYAEALLKFKDVIEVEYTANYIGSESLASVIQDDSGIFFVHYSVQPDKLSVLSDDKDFRLDFDLNGIVTDLNGNLVFQYDRTFPLQFTAGQIQDIGKTAVVIQDAIPLVPGEYKFSLLMKNTASKEFTSFEKMITIPDTSSSGFGISPLLLGYKIEKIPLLPRVNKPFRVSDLQISCQARNVFHPKEGLVVFFQMFGLPESLRQNGRLEFAFFRQDQEFKKEERRLAEIAQRNVFQEFSLQEFPPDYYSIRVSVLDEQSRALVAAKADFEVTPMADIPRPWVISKVMPPAEHSLFPFILGEQLVKKGDLDAAEAFLGQAFQMESENLSYALSYGNLLIKKREFGKAKQILLPFSKAPRENFQALALLGRSCQAQGEYSEAALYYGAFLQHAGANLDILNSLGECYFQLGKVEEARSAWEKSLEMNPKQDKIRELLQRIKE